MEEKKVTREEAEKVLRENASKITELVVSICLYLVEADLENYKRWKRQRENA